MTQIPIINGIFTDQGPDIRTSYPVNLIPVPKANGISQGYLRPGDGLVADGLGPGIDRGAIAWNGICYRVMGSRLTSVAADGTIVEFGFIPGVNQVTFAYSFDLLAIAADGALFLFDGTTITQNTDPDLGVVLDVVWVDGYFMTTDGSSLVVTDLNNPFAVNPLKYGSSEADPDPIEALLKLRNEVAALNRNTIEFFDNIGGDLFPFQRIEGAQIQKGVIGTNACCVFVDAIAFLGSGFNEAPGIYLGVNAVANKISTREIDTLLLDYTEAELSQVLMEARNDRAHQHLYIHLPDRTLVFDAAATRELEGEPVWFVLTSTVDGFAQYRARNMVWCHDQWMIGDPQAPSVGHFDITISSHYGEPVRWEFGTLIVYNESRGAIFHEMELVALTGRVALGANPMISTSYSVDGETWSQERFIAAGASGQRKKRLVWFQQGHMEDWRIQRFKGDSDAHLSFPRLEVRLEPLAW